MEKGGKLKLVSAVITVFIITILIVTGPANAVIIGMTVLDDNVVKGDVASFTASVEIEDGEALDITQLGIDLSGLISTGCTFLPDGTKITSCTGFNITLLSSAPFGYGYGYGYGFTKGTLSYLIEVDTTNYPTGTYNTNILAFTPEQIIQDNGPDIVILAKKILLEKCSVRADQGNLTVGEESFLGNKNKLNFYIPQKDATKGQGSLTAQYDKRRFSYSFDITDIQENNPTRAVILATGEYRINTGEKITQDSVIYLDKVEKTVDIVAPDFSAEDLKISLMKGCV